MYAACTGAVGRNFIFERVILDVPLTLKWFLGFYMIAFIISVSKAEKKKKIAMYTQ